MFVFITSQIIAEAAAMAYVAKERERIRLGLPPSPPPSPETPEQIRETKRNDALFMVAVFIEGLLWCSPFFGLIFLIWKIVDLKLSGKL